jgi:hypothetical protein
MEPTVKYAVTVYSILLCLYPVGFRRRFGQEMAGVFRECCHDELHTRGLIGCVALCLHTLKDLVVSAGRERIYELTSLVDLDHPVFGIIDSTLMPTIIVSKLIALGCVVTVLFFRGKLGNAVSVDDFMIISGSVSVLFGVLGVISSVIMRRLRPTVRLWVKLS